MKKEILKSLIVSGLVTGLQAGGDIGGVVSFENPDVNIVIPEPDYVPVMSEPVVIQAPAPAPVVVPVQAPAPIVVVPAPAPKPKPVVKKVVPKGPSNFYTVLKGISIMGDTYNCNCTDSGYGAGLDLGYKLGNGFATELGLSYAKNDLNNVSGDVSHKTGSLSLVYTYPLTDVLGLFGKVGYMIEESSLTDSDNESGLVYGGGLEYGLGGNYAILGEYQATTIDSLRGDAASLGLKYNF
jgi:hypothetical protein